MASLHADDLVDLMGNDDFARLVARAAVAGAGDEWDDELVTRTIDEVVADMVPPPRRARIETNQPSSDDEDEDDGPNQQEVERAPSTDAAAAKRRRHREAMQRCRERKRSRMGALEKQQRQLKTLLKQRLWELRLRDDRVGATPLATSPASMEDLRKMFVDVVRLKEELLDERQALQASILKHQKFEKIVNSATKQIVNETTAPPALGGPDVRIYAASHSDSLEDEASSSGQDSTDASGSATRKSKGRPAGHWVQYLDHEEPLFYEPEPEESVADHTRECFLRVRRLQDSFVNRISGLGIQDTYCLGWHAQHTVVRSPEGRLELRFRFQRRVPLQRMSLAEIQRATWNVMKDPVQNARLYSSLVVCKIVQFIGDNTFIFIRNAPDKDKRLHIRYFSMHSQIHYRTDQNERATVTLMKILDKDPHAVEPQSKPAMPVVWLKEGTLFLGFTEKLASQEIEIEYGGATQCMSEQHAAYLLTEVGGALMRWEQMVIPQRLLF